MGFFWKHAHVETSNMVSWRDAVRLRKELIIPWYFLSYTDFPPSSLSKLHEMLMGDDISFVFFISELKENDPVDL